MRFTPIPTPVARHYQSGGLDAYGLAPERSVSDGGGNPCRHCLKMIPKGEAFLILAHRPFPDLQPYAETGPIFLCAGQCEGEPQNALPDILASPDNIVRGYGADDRIVYGTGGVIPTEGILARGEELFRDARVAYLHIRSARNNCFQCRLDRG